MANNGKTQTQSGDVSSAAPTRPPRITNLQGLLYRENVGWVMAFGCVEKMTIELQFVGNEQDVRQFDVGGEGSFALVWLKDDPHEIGGRFVEIRPPQKGAQ